MKTKTLKSVLAVLGVLLSLNAFAYDIEIDGIYYNVVKKTKQAEVTSGDSEYTGEVTIPASFEYDGVTYSVTIIGNQAFSYCSGLTSITIPNSVTSIGNYAFDGCSGLTSITIPNSVTSIGNWVFYGCSGLTSLTFPNSVTSIGERAFDGCSGLTSITIPNSVTSIGQYAFRGCKNLTSVTIPNSVTSIGNQAFSGCSGRTAVHITDLASWCYISFGDNTYNYGAAEYSNPLSYAHHLYLNGEEVKDLVIPNSVTSIDRRAFYGCENLTSVTIPNSVTSIGIQAFYGCSGLTSVTIPNSVTSIGDEAFRGCQSLTSINIPNSVTSIGSRVFPSRRNGLNVYITDLISWCNIDRVINDLSESPVSYTLYLNDKEIKDLVIPNNVIEIGKKAFFGCSSITSVTIPNSVEIIGWSAFNGCENLTSVTIPNSVTIIGQQAFERCSNLTSVTIPNSVKNIYSSAFSGCNNLKTVTCLTKEALTNATSIFGSNAVLSEATLYVPSSLVSAYKAITPWNKFGKILAIVDIVPMEEEVKISFSENITEETDLSSTVIDNVYVTLDKEGNDGYDVERKCIMLATTVTDEQITAIVNKEMVDESVKENFNGLIFEVPAGSGTISLTMQTKGNSALNVKIGGGEVQKFVQPEQGIVKIPYTVESDTYVYLYGANLTNNIQRRVSAQDLENGVLIYDLKWNPNESTGVAAIETKKNNRISIYTMDGRQTKALQKGMNIIRYSDGTTKKVLVK